MTMGDYKKMTLTEMQSRKWRTASVITTGVIEIPSGTLVEITGKAGGLIIKGPTCPHCKVAIFARKVSPYDVEEI